jgi:hypothetical protein
MDFLGDIPFLQRYLMTALISTSFSIWSKWHTPLLIKNVYYVTRVTRSVNFNNISVTR